MTRDDIVDIFTRRQVFWKQRDPEALASAHAQDGVIMSPIFGTIRGYDAILKSYRNLFDVFQDWTFNSDELLIDGDRAAQVFHIMATHSKELFGVEATGRTFEAQGVLYFRLEHGKIAFEQRYYDFTGMLIQLGVLKARPR